MAQTLNSNMASLTAQRHLSSSQNQTATAMQRLSSGLRVNSAKDDAAGQAIAERMTSQVRGMNQAIRNSNDGISMVQTMESTWGKVSDALQRMRELAIQSGNDTNSASDRDSLNKEFQKLGEEVNRLIQGTTFNGKSVLATDGGAGGTGAGSFVFQIGANTTSDVDTITIQTSDWTKAEVNDGTGTETTGNGNKINLLTGIANDGTNGMESIGSTQADGVTANDNAYINTVIDKIDAAIDQINDQRATLGSFQSSFESTISNLQSASEAQSSAKSRIMDADYAAESSNLSRAQILQQAGNAMLAQANQQPQQIMKLLQG